MKNRFYQFQRSLVLLGKQFLTDIVKRKLLSIVLLMVVAGVVYFAGVKAGILWFLFLSFALYDWDNRIIGSFGIVSLISCPFLIQLNYEVYAENMAVNAWFFMVIFVALQMINFIRHPESVETDYEKA